MCGNTLNRTRAGGAIEIPKGPEKREKATLVYIVTKGQLISKANFEVFI